MERTWSTYTVYVWQYMRQRLFFLVCVVENSVGGGVKCFCRCGKTSGGRQMLILIRFEESRFDV
jgi:hypothetical protein